MKKLLLIVLITHALPAQNLLLHSTLDDLAAVLAPTIGVGHKAVVSTFPPNDFCISGGLCLDANGEYARFAQTHQGTNNWNSPQGSVVLDVCPQFTTGDGTESMWFQAGERYGALSSNPQGFDFKNPGLFEIGVHAGGEFMVIYWEPGSDPLDPQRVESNVAVGSPGYGWTAGQCIVFQVDYAWAVAAGERNIRVYQDGVELDVRGWGSANPPHTGPKAYPVVDGHEFLWVGGQRHQGVPWSTNVHVRDVKIYDAPLTSPPLPPPPPTEFALEFNGNDIATGPNFSPPRQFSLSTWIRPNSTGDRHIISIREPNSNPNVHLRLWPPNLMRIVAGFSGGLGSWEIPGPVLGTWQHVAVVFDGSSAANDPEVYLNGVLLVVIERGMPSGMMNLGVSPIRVGSNHVSATFDGRIDDTRIYSRLLTAAEVSVLHTEGPGECSPEVGLEAGWSFDEGVGPVAGDCSGNGRDLTISGAAWVPQ